MRLAMQNKHSVFGHSRSARALERAKLDRSFNKDKRQFAGCYGCVEDEEAITYVKRSGMPVKYKKVLRKICVLVLCLLYLLC